MSDRRGQRMEALAGANEVRFFRGNLRQRWMVMEPSLVFDEIIDLLDSSEPMIQTWKVTQMLSRIPGCGPKEVNRLMDLADIRDTARVQNLTPKEMYYLINALNARSMTISGRAQAGRSMRVYYANKRKVSNVAV